MMDRRQQVKSLLAAGVPPQSFQLPGVHSHDPLPLDFWFLRSLVWSYSARRVVTDAGAGRVT
jgi:hypothetical protein